MGIFERIHISKKRTRGSETSQYPEEKKSNEITLVVASERVRAQTLFIYLNKGLWDRDVGPMSLEEQSGKTGQRG